MARWNVNEEYKIVYYIHRRHVLDDNYVFYATLCKPEFDNKGSINSNNGIKW